MAKKIVKSVKKAKKDVKTINAAVLTDNQLINLAAMISEGTAFLLGKPTLSQISFLTKEEKQSIDGWFASDATQGAKDFINQEGVVFLLTIIGRLTGENFGEKIEFDKFTGKAIGAPNPLPRGAKTP